MLRASAITFLGLVLLSGAQPAKAQSFEGRFESKLHYRYSEHNRFAVQFPFPPAFLPTGASTAFLETVDEGHHVELSTLNFAGQWRFSDDVAAQFRFDVVDLYDRNPTSSDVKFDLDHGFLRWGNALAPLAFSSQRETYAQIGKFAKFERQRARRSESYGLVSTAFNRFEDSGLELGIDFASGAYAKFSWTTGNPVFMRDPNALAGDNGTAERRVPPENPDPELKSGIVILYDAEIETFELDSDSELGGGLGYRWRSGDEHWKLNLLAFHYQRSLQEDRSLHGTFYGSDLDLFDLGEVPGAGGIRLPAEGDDKAESGLNFWLSAGNFASFFQAVKQNMAELKRDGFEWELSYIIDGRYPLTPVLRYSELDNDFVGSPLYPAPSVWWDWRKIDYALNIDLSKDVRIILEYSQNLFERGGKTRDNNEAMMTIRWSGEL